MLKRIALGLIRLYQCFLRPLLPCSCRFVPSCSEYAKEALERYGFFKGATLSLKRLLACHPFSGKSGYDPLK
ncbi:MAG: membrane protein insertion efficiency factor YidD [Candidatus Omnitrophica bacterium]|nr:membrane protein insertion efficiency factor YidD [Candidatus Omnitrophota bacterium]MDD5653394.1 membrane protein insertion efficiency factor YidD [Candidatus Omnitrophota bacterium]